MEEEMKTILMEKINVEDILQDFRPLLIIYKDGRIHRFLGTATVSAGADPITGVDSKDVVISPETGVFVRLYKPPNLTSHEKLPLLVYFHGGAFCIESAASPMYHNHLNALSSQAKVIIVSVDYRIAPENPIPAAYDDSWSAVKWVAGDGETWLTEHADYSRVFFAGDSAGANIAHNMAKRIAKEPVSPIYLNGIVLIHPYFWGEERIGFEEQRMIANPGLDMVGKLWKLACPGTSGLDDPLINPAMDPELGGLGGEKVLVMVAEQDALRDRGFHYKEALVKSGWKGAAEVVETVGENHVFHLMNPASSNTVELMNKFVAFLNSSPSPNNHQ